MGKWVKERLGTKSTISRGGSPRPIEDYVSPEFEGYNWIKIGDVKPGAKYIESTAEKMIPAGLTKTREVHAGDFLLSNSMSFGRPYISKIDGCIHDGWLAIQSYNETFDTNFLYYCLGAESTIAQYRSLAAGSTVLNLKKEMVAKVNVTYPVSLDEQRHIAEILTTCDEVIEKSEAVAEKYRAIKAGMLNDLFTRGIGKNGKLRPPPESSPQLYKDTALGKVPREWEVKSFDSAFELHGNNTLSRAFLTNQNGVVRNVHYGDVLVKYDTILDCDDEALPSVIAEGVRQAGNDYLQNGDLVFADTAEDDTVGKAVELYNVGDRTIVSGLHTIFARPKEDDFASRWLGYYVNSDSFHKQLLPFVVGSKVSSISRTNIKRTFVVIPESDEQQRIAERLSVIDVKIADELAVIAKYRKVKTGLMARLLTPPDGEVE